MDQQKNADGPPLAVVLKGYPRLSETFIAQELLELQNRGHAFEIWSLRQPYDGGRTHPIHDQITAAVFARISLPSPWPAAAGVVGSTANARLSRRTPGMATRLETGPNLKPGTALGASFDAGGGTASVDAVGLCALPPHTWVGRTVCGNDPRCAVGVFGPRERHLDDTGMGKAGEDRLRNIRCDLHRIWGRASSRSRQIGRYGGSGLSRPRSIAFS